MRKIGLFLGPLLFIFLLLMPPPSSLTPEGWRVLAMAGTPEGWRVLAMAGLMLVWWITEAVPIPVTALLPMVLLPLLNVSDMETAAAPYASPIVFLFMGGFMLALAMEKWQLHRRIALNIVRLTGTNANGIILGFMLATAFLSMWISNTATAIMMLPIATSVVDLLMRGRQTATPAPGVKAFALTLMLGIAYSANIGGMATLVGTPPNVVFAGFIRETYEVEVSFARWMMVGLPFAAILLTLTYLFMVHVMYPNRLGRFAGAQELIARELADLGSIDKAELRTLIIFICTALAWIFRVQLNQFLPFQLGDPEIAVLATLALFVTPVDFRSNMFLLDWGDTIKLPWGILLLFGGGLSLADALEATGLIGLIGEAFAGLTLNTFLVILGLTTISLFLTEIMSNVALVTVLLPVVGGIAAGTGIEPLLLCVPVTLAASCAFMFPMSTPPNAIVFASGHLRIVDMARTGIVLNLLTILLTAVFGYLVLDKVF